MKKLLFLFAVLTCFFTITSCNDDESKKESTTDSTLTNIDSTKTDTTKKLAPPPVDLTKYVIDEATANAMIKYKPAFPHNPNKIDSTIKNDILLQYPNAIITTFKAKYRDTDVNRYTNTRGFQPNSDTGKVKNYKTFIYKVEIPGTVTSAVPAPPPTTTYYDFVTICPPPDGSDCKWIQNIKKK